MVQVEPSADALLALVMADEAGFGQLVAHLVSRCPDETSAARLQGLQGLQRSQGPAGPAVARRSLQEHAGARISMTFL